MNTFFYVYALLDTSKPGNYTYENLKFDYEPFYIGKGHDKRNESHFRLVEYKSSQNSFKDNKIRKLIKNGCDLVSELVFENLSEKKAFEIERHLIKKIGRRNLNKGPLTNLTDGGEGMTGYICTPEHKAKISFKIKLMWKKRTKEEYDKICAKIGNNSKSLKGRSLTEEHKKNISENNIWKGKTLTEEEIANRVKGRLKKGVGRKKLYQYSIDDFKLIKVHDSVRFAATELNLRESGIAKAARQKRQFKGFIWSYAELKEKPVLKKRGDNLKNLPKESKEKRDQKRKETWAKKKEFSNK